MSTIIAAVTVAAILRVKDAQSKAFAALCALVGFVVVALTSYMAGSKEWGVDGQLPAISSFPDKTVFLRGSDLVMMDETRTAILREIDSATKNPRGKTRLYDIGPSSLPHYPYLIAIRESTNGGFAINLYPLYITKPPKLPPTDGLTNKTAAETNAAKLEKTGKP
ncbi:MAG TPA: hypothetical protein DEP25_03225 [Candidatus Taylorbacteria bacterium]|nr:hypothetical protein [Candidatus Taylorbacteria bacterium]